MVSKIIENNLDILPQIVLLALQIVFFNVGYLEVLTFL
jgi:hypothetical protein